jgi:hypothetical protein
VLSSSVTGRCLLSFGAKLIQTLKMAKKQTTDRPREGSIGRVEVKRLEQELQRELKEPCIRRICLERDRSGDCARGGCNPS